MLLSVPTVQTIDSRSLFVFAFWGQSNFNCKRHFDNRIRFHGIKIFHKSSCDPNRTDIYKNINSSTISNINYDKSQQTFFFLSWFYLSNLYVKRILILYVLINESREHCKLM